MLCSDVLAASCCYDWENWFGQVSWLLGCSNFHDALVEKTLIMRSTFSWVVCMIFCVSDWLYNHFKWAYYFPKIVWIHALVGLALHLMRFILFIWGFQMSLRSRCISWYWQHLKQEFLSRISKFPDNKSCSEEM